MAAADTQCCGEFFGGVLLLGVEILVAADLIRPESASKR
jgi:hypothetical protein